MRADQRLHGFGREFLAVLGAGGAADALVHQRAAEVVGARLQRVLRALRPHLHPARLDVRDMRVQDEARDAVHQQRLAEGRAAPRLAAEVHRRFHMDEGQRHEFGEAARLGLQVAQRQQMARPVQRPLDMAEHDGGGACAGRGECAVRATSSHSRGVDLVRADDGADLVVQDLRRGARQGAEAGRLQPRQVVAQRQAERRRALRHLERREGVDVHAPAALRGWPRRCRS